MIISREQIEEIHESLRTAQPCSGKTGWGYWRVPGDGLQRTQSETPIAGIQYRYDQLHAIANLPKYRAKGVPQDLWLRNGILFLFSTRTPIQDWTEFHNERYDLRPDLNVFDKQQLY